MYLNYFPCSHCILPHFSLSILFVSQYFHSSYTLLPSFSLFPPFLCHSSLTFKDIFHHTHLPQISPHQLLLWTLQPWSSYLPTVLNFPGSRILTSQMGKEKKKIILGLIDMQHTFIPINIFLFLNLWIDWNNLCHQSLCWTLSKASKIFIIFLINKMITRYAIILSPKPGNIFNQSSLMHCCRFLAESHSIMVRNKSRRWLQSS